MIDQKKITRGRPGGRRPRLRWLDDVEEDNTKVGNKKMEVLQ